ncbi:MAG: helix-turn-helix transcriptional regulator [Pseudomonadota bacterium]
MTYEVLAQKAGLSRATLESIASRKTYNTRLSTIDILCTALECHPGDLLTFTPENGSGENEDR